MTDVVQFTAWLRGFIIWVAGFHVWIRDMFWDQTVTWNSHTMELQLIIKSSKYRARAHDYMHSHTCTKSVLHLCHHSPLHLLAFHHSEFIRRRALSQWRLYHFTCVCFGVEFQSQRHLHWVQNMCMFRCRVPKSAALALGTKPVYVSV